jgi:hypothetical protein
MLLSVLTKFRICRSGCCPQQEQEQGNYCCSSSNSRSSGSSGSSCQSQSCGKDAATSADAFVIIPSIGTPIKSIYDLFSAKRRYVILFTTALAAILLPFTDTIYLPALQVSSMTHHSLLAVKLTAHDDCLQARAAHP